MSASESSLTMADIRHAWGSLGQEHPFIKAVREAHDVEIKTSPYMRSGTLYALDPKALSLLDLTASEPLLVLCSPADRTIAQRVVSQIRRLTSDDLLGHQ